MGRARTADDPAGDRDGGAPPCDLLTAALEAHGGLARWRGVREVRARLRSGGFALASKWKGRALRAYEATISTAVPRVVLTPYPGPGCRGVFEAAAVSIETDAGTVLARRRDPRAEFRRARRLLWWDHLDPHHSPARGFLGPRRVTLGRSRVRESRTLGSVGAKAEWLSYPTIPPQSAPAAV